MNRRVSFPLTAALVAATFLVAFPGCSAGADDVAAGDAAPAGDAAQFKNVKILTHVTSKTEMRRIMKEQAAALGVKCSHCHVPGKFDLDDKKEKLVAREMMRMVANLNSTVFKEAEKKPAISCWTCHRGGTEPEATVPQSALDKLDAQQ